MLKTLDILLGMTLMVLGMMRNARNARLNSHLNQHRSHDAAKPKANWQRGIPEYKPRFALPEPTEFLSHKTLSQ